MTCAEIAARILARVDDTATAPLSVTPDPLGGVSKEILAAINEGQELAAMLTLCLETTATFTAPASTAFIGLRTIFADYLVPLRLMGPSGRLLPSTLGDLDAHNDQWQSTIGLPVRYLAMGFNFLAVTPQSSTDTTLSLTYARSPAQMTTDAFPELPEEYHADLVDYGIYRVRLKEGAQGLARGMQHLNRFLDRMTKLGDYVRARSRASRYDILPFELALFDRSRLMPAAAERVAAKNKLPSQ